MVLVKPQFEAGRGQAPGGVVRDPVVHRRTVDGVVLAARAAGLRPLDVIASPILGPEGNREFLLHIRVPNSLGGPGGAVSGARAGRAEGAPTGGAVAADVLAARIATVTAAAATSGEAGFGPERA